MLNRTPKGPRRPTQTIVTNLRIRESLRRALELEAEKNEVSLSREMVARLEASLLSNTKLDLVSLTGIRNDFEGLRDEMLVIWLKFKSQTLTQEHEAAIFTAIDEGDIEGARDHLAALRRVREIAARQRTAGRLSGLAPTVTISPAKIRRNANGKPPR